MALYYHFIGFNLYYGGNTVIAMFQFYKILGSIVFVGLPFMCFSFCAPVGGYCLFNTTNIGQINNITMNFPVKH